MTKALELAKFGRETPPTGVVVGDSDTQTLSSKTFSDGPVFSSGAVNAVPYLNASKVFSTAATFVFDGTNLGIGVASPGYMLHVKGGALGVTSADGTVTSIINYNSLGTVTNTDFVFNTNSAERARVSSTGLAVTGALSTTGNVSVSSTNPTLTLTRTDNGTSPAASINFSATSTVKWQIATNQAIGPGLEFNAGNGTSNKMYLNTAGNLGIGNSNPTAKLHIKGTEYAQYIETDSTTNGDAIRLALVAPGAQSQVELEWWNDSTKTGGGYGLIQTGKTGNSPNFNFMVGNVGISTTNPTAKLDVAGGGLSVSGWSNNNSGSAGGIEIGWDGAQSVIQSYNRVGNGYTPLAFNASKHIFGTGSVGIGITDPISPLHVKTGGNVFTVPTQNAIGGGTGSRVHFIGTEPGLMLSSDMNLSNAVSSGTGTASLGLQIGYYGANDVRSQLYWAGTPLTFTYGSNPTASPQERMRILTNGNLAIGTTANTAQKLNVNGAVWLLGNDDASYSTIIEPRYDSAQPFAIRTRNNDSTMVNWLNIYADGGGSNNRIVLGAGGWPVVIGATTITTGLGFKLKVDGNTQLWNSVNSGSEIRRFSWYNGIYNNGSIRMIVGAGQINRGEMGFYVNNGAEEQLAQYIDYAQNVLLTGTTTGTVSAAKLQIQTPASQTNAIDVITTGGTANNGGSFGMFSDAVYISSNWYYAGGQLKRVAANGSANIVLASASTDVGTYIAFATGITAAGSPTERMRINTDGNVGIGTTDPQTKLQIGNYTSDVAITLANLNNGSSRINFYDQNNSEGTYLKATGETYGGTISFGARWDDDEDKMVLKMYQPSAGGGSYHIRVGIGTNNPGAHLEIAASAPQLILNADTQATNFKKVRLASSNNNAGDFVISAINDDTSLKNYMLYVSNAGSVGIGNTGPTNKLDVSGTIGKKYTSNITVPANNTATAVLNLSNGENFSNWLAANMNTGGPCTGTISITWDTGGSANSSIWSFAKHSGFNGVSITLMSSVSYNGDTTASGGIISSRNNGAGTVTPIFNVILTSS